MLYFDTQAIMMRKSRRQWKNRVITGLWAVAAIAVAAFFMGVVHGGAV